MGISDLGEYLGAAKTLLDLFKGVRDELPQTEKSSEIDDKIEQVERALKLSEAEMAKALGYKLCHCTFPPVIMLWNEVEKADICESCGRQLTRDGDRLFTRVS